MADFYEIDFLNVQSSKSGDAIPLRYSMNGQTLIHVVDGGFFATGDHVVKHIDAFYDAPDFIDHVVATHPDGDHAAGLRTVLETYVVGRLWLHRPWLYTDDLIHRFPRYTNADNLARRLREVYPNLHILEQIAVEREIPISEPFQGAQIGAFVVLSPTYDLFLDLVAESEKTPESTATNALATGGLFQITKKLANLFAAAWGEEVFSTEETSAENEMSVVQGAILGGKRVLLTGDAGRRALATAADAASLAGFTLPGIDVFQVPHHGSRRNVSTDLLDRWLGPRWASDPGPGEGVFEAYISAAKEDEHHPRKSVIRACVHRGGNVLTNERCNIYTFLNVPMRPGYTPLPPVEYPYEQES